jgi:antitoxin MazE
MRNDSRLARWGNGLAIRIPLAIAQRAGLAEGSRVTLALDRKGCIVLRPARQRYDLWDLVAQITPRNCHGETDWEGARGEESW